VNRAPATAKLNLALVVGPLREDGNHEVATVLQRLDLADRVSIEPAAELRIEGFADDTLVRDALQRLAEAAGAEPRWLARIWKHVPVAAGLGGGSSDAATALRLANETLVEPVSTERLHELAAGLGADVPFFLTSGPQLGTGTGTKLEPLELPQDYWVVLLLPQDERKPSTTRSTAATAPPASRSGSPPCATRSPLPSDRATWPRCRRTTSSSRRRMPSGCSSSGLFALT
jgi:4-diphosphocytidyl-2C-methyl-D-erythritol kinase